MALGTFIDHWLLVLHSWYQLPARSTNDILMVPVSMRSWDMSLPLGCSSWENTHTNTKQQQNKTKTQTENPYAWASTFLQTPSNNLFSVVAEATGTHFLWLIFLFPPSPVSF